LDIEVDISVNTSGGFDIASLFHFGQTCSPIYANIPPALRNKSAA
jgi:hypothetical protein